MRFKAGITQAELGLMIGRGMYTIAKYECGERPITPEIAYKISQVFGWDLSLVLVGNNKQIELSGEEYQKYFSHLIKTAPYYERRRKKKSDETQQKFLSRKWIC